MKKKIHNQRQAINLLHPVFRDLDFISLSFVKIDSDYTVSDRGKSNRKAEFLKA